MAIPRKQFRSISKSIENLVKPIFKTRGFSKINIISDWSQIVGPELAERTLPEKITFSHNKQIEGTMHLRVGGSSLALELQHKEHQIIEKVNTYYGYRAIKHIQIIQGLIKDLKDTNNEDRRSLNNNDKESLENSLSTLSDFELKKALSRLGAEVRRRN